MAFLKVLNGCQAGAQIPLGWRVLVLGSRPTADAVLTDPWIAPRHARIHPTTRGHSLEALSDNRPVQVNDQALEGRHLLVHGDTLALGHTLIRYQSVPAETKKQPEAVPEEPRTEPAKEEGSTGESVHYRQELERANARIKELEGFREDLLRSIRNQEVALEEAYRAIMEIGERHAQGLLNASERLSRIRPPAEQNRSTGETTAEKPEKKEAKPRLSPSERFIRRNKVRSRSEILLPGQAKKGKEGKKSKAGKEGSKKKPTSDRLRVQKLRGKKEHSKEKKPVIKGAIPEPLRTNGTNGSEIKGALLVSTKKAKSADEIRREKIQRASSRMKVLTLEEVFEPKESTTEPVESSPSMRPKERRRLKRSRPIATAFAGLLLFTFLGFALYGLWLLLPPPGGTGSDPGYGDVQPRTSEADEKPEEKEETDDPRNVKSIFNEMKISPTERRIDVEQRKRTPSSGGNRRRKKASSTGGTQTAEKEKTGDSSESKESERVATSATEDPAVKAALEDLMKAFEDGDGDRLDAARTRLLSYGNEGLDAMARALKKTKNQDARQQLRIAIEGALKEKSTVELLETMRQSEDFALRSFATVQLTKKASENDLELLVSIARSPEEDSQIRKAAIQGIRSVGNERAVEAMSELARNGGNVQTRLDALSAVGATRSKEALPVIMDLAKPNPAEDNRIRGVAITNMGNYPKNPDVIRSLVDMLGSEDSVEMKSKLLLSLGKVGGDREREIIQQLYESETHPRIRYRAKQALQRIEARNRRNDG